MTRILLPSEIDCAAPVVLDGEELHYLSRVRRHRPGDTVELRAPGGRCFRADIIEISAETAVLQVKEEVIPTASVLPVRLIVAIPKRQLLEDVVRMAGELGVERICPVLAERTVVQPKGEKIERWRRIAEESIRQSGRSVPVEVEDIRPLPEALEQFADGTRLFLHPSPNGPRLADLFPLAPPVTAVIGPEGGFTEKEVALARSLSYLAVRLDTPILRIETAAVAAAALCGAGLQRSETT